MADLNLLLRLQLSPEAARTIATLQSIGPMGIKGNAAIERSTKGATTEMDRLGQKGKFVKSVLEAFILYKGFVFLKSQVEEFIRSLVDLEHQVALVQTQLNRIGVDFRPRITMEVIETAKETGLAFDALAKAEFNIVSANIAVSESFDILDASAKAAVAGGLKNVDVAFNSALAQVNAFRLGNEAFARVFDRQFNLVKRGIFTYEQFANVVGEVSIAFAGMGQDVETANAALAAVSQVFTGPQLSEGAVGLKNAALQISENVERFEDFGIAVTDVNGDFRDFIDILRDLESRLRGLPEAEQAGILKELFQEKRAVRGIKVLLTELDEMETFFVEQKFAAGDLDQAFKTMNDTLLFQAQVFRNELVPAMKPFADSLKTILEVVNSLNRSLGGGLTPALLQTMLFGGAIGGTRLLLGSKLSRQAIVGASASQFGPVPIMGNRMTGLGMGIGAAGFGLAGVSAFGAGRGGAGMGGAIGAAGMGALAGSAFGPLGAAIGGAANLMVFGLGTAFKKEAPNIAKSFSDKLKDALVATGGDMARALLMAVKDEAAVAATTLTEQAVFLGAMTRLISRPTGRMIELPGELGGGGLPGINLPGGRRVGGSTVEEIEVLRRSEPVSQAIIDIANEIREQASTRAGGGEAPEAVLSELIATATNVGNLSEIFGEGANEAANFIEILAKSNLTLDEANKVWTEFVSAMAEARTEEQRAALSTKFLEDIFAEAAVSIKSTVDAFENLDKILKISIGSIESIEEIFQSMGSEGAAVAESLATFSSVFNRADLLKGIKDLLAGIGLDVAPDAFNPFFEAATSRILEPLTGAGTSLVEFFSDPKNADKLINAMMPAGEQAAALIAPAMTSLAESAFKASEMIELGLVDPMGFTANELQMLGEELQEFNRTIRKVQIVEELARLGEIAGFGSQSLQPVIAGLLENMTIGGQSFRDIFSKPEGLAELLSRVEFGDVNIDQSTSQDVNNNIVIRVSGGSFEDPLELAKIADRLVGEINTKMKEKR